MFGNLEGKGAGDVKLFVKDQLFPLPVFFDFATARPGAPGGQKSEMGRTGLGAGTGSFWRLQRRTCSWPLPAPEATGIP